MQRPLNICFDDRIFTIQQYGGISRYYTELARGLIGDERQNVRIDAPAHINRYISALPCHAGIRLPYFRGVTRLCQRFNDLRADTRLNTFAPDIVHETYFRSRAPEVRKAKRVITVYDLIHERFADPSGRDALSMARRSAIERSDHIICISHSTQRDLIELSGVDQAKTSVIHLAASLRAGDDLPRPLDARYILYVGPRDRYKNFQCLLQAYAALPGVMRDFNLLCVGGGSFTGQETSAMRKLGISEQRVIQMNADDRMLSTCYRYAALLVYPSLYEGFGIPPLEAMQCGCPVICADSSSLPEVVGDAALMFDPQSPDSLAAALEKMLYGSAIAEEYVQRGVTRAAGFSWRSCVSQTLNLYRYLAG